MTSFKFTFDLLSIIIIGVKMGSDIDLTHDKIWNKLPAEKKKDTNINRYWQDKIIVIKFTPDHRK